MLNLAGANSKSQRAKRSVRRSVTVAAHNRLPWLRNPQFRPDDVHNALVLAIHVEQMHARLRAIAFQRFELPARVRIQHRQQPILRRNRVIHHRKSQLRAPHFAPRGLQPSKRLRRSALMNQMSVNINQGRLPRLFPHHVGIPDFFVKRACSHSFGFLPGELRPGNLDESWKQSASQPLL